MSIIDKALEANRNYARNYDPTLGKHPAPKIVVVTCMDPRLSDLPGILGLPQADIDVIRTGGPAVTEDVLGELIVSNRVLGTTEILLLNHTGCGFTTFTDGEMNASWAPPPVMRRRLRCDSSPIRTRRKIPGSRSRKSGRIPGLPKMSPCAGLFSTWTPVSCGKCSQLRSTLLPERLWTREI